MASKGVENAKVIVGIVLALLPYLLKIFNIDVPDMGGFENDSEALVNAIGIGTLAKSEKV